MNNEYGLYYNSHNLIFKNPFGAVETEAKVAFRLDMDAWAAANAEVYLCLNGKRLISQDEETALVLSENGYRYETYSEMVKMEKSDAGNGRVKCVCEYVAPSKAITLEYFFKVEVGAGAGFCAGAGSNARVVYYANNRRNAGGIGECYGSYEDMVGNGCKYSMNVFDKDFHTPDWFKNAVMYQIFPDRFYNGNEDGSVFVKEREKDEYKIYSSWDEPMDLNYGVDDPVRGERRIRNDFYGGNLRGLLAKADYFAELGIDTIYLNPIFEAYSNHRYDTGDYMKIDPMLGTNEDFREVAEALKKRGIRLVLDGVFNHTGSDSKYFNRYGKYDSVGAAQSKDSPYADWYTFKNFDANPDEYDCWWGISNVPNVNEMCDSYFNYILGDAQVDNDKGDVEPTGVVQYWLKKGASGWRLDVADELPTPFLERLRAQVKAVDENALIIGEVWEDASRKYSYGEQREYLLGKQLDSVMNYPFYDAVLGYVGGNLRAEDLAEAMMRIHENYPRECLYSLMNIIGTHDKPRAKTIFGSSGNGWADGGFDGVNDLANNRMKQAALFQMTYVGVPCIYYGDEIGMSGAGDPLNRGAFEWHNINEDLLGFYRAAVTLRKEYPEFVSGEFRVLHAKGEIFAFERYMAEQAKEASKQGSVARRFVVVFNNSATEWRGCSLNLGVDVNLEKNVKISHVFGMCHVEGDNISLPPTGGAVFEML